MATSKKFSELPAASSVGNGDLFAIAHEDALAETGYVSQKLTAAQAGQKVNGDTEYPTSLPSFPANGQNPFAALEKLNADIEVLYPVNTASGAIANFTTSLAKPLTALTSTIVAQQASGTPTPSSPLPISGFSSVGLKQTGVNLWSYGDISGTFRRYFEVDIPSGEYNLSLVVTSSDIQGTKSLVSFVYDDESTIFVRFDRDTRQNASITFTQHVKQVYFYAGYNYDQSGGDTFSYNDIQLEVGSTATAYEAYNAETKTITLPSTIYGGNVDCINGTGMKTVKYFSFSEAQYYGTYGVDNANLYYVEIPDYATDKIKQMSSSSFDGILISNMMSKISDSSSRMKDNEIRTNAGANINTFYFRADEFADLTALNAFLAVTPLQVVAELQTPVEITGLTPDNFTTIAGVNNIFSDCGDVTVQFKQNIQEYIDAKIAETQALIL